MKRLGIVAHSAEGAALCYLTACRHGGQRLGAYAHPTIAMSAIPMSLSMDGWESGEHDAVANHLADGVKMVADSGADFYICPDNTAHIVLERLATELPIPGLHIADVVCDEIARAGWSKVGILGTKWTTGGPVYPDALGRRSMTPVIPSDATRHAINDAIFDELCHGVITPETTTRFIDAVDELADAGAECVVLGCTEIPLVLTPENSPLPPLDSTRLLAKRAVDACIDGFSDAGRPGWITPNSQ